MANFNHLNIIFYDDQCVVCNYWVNLLLKSDKKNRLLFAPLESELGKTIVANTFNLVSNYEQSVLFYNGGKLFEKSEAIEQCFSYLDLKFRVIKGILKIVPLGFKNFIYDFIAKNRYHWFGIKNSCEMLPPEYSRKIVTSLNKAELAFKLANES